MRNTHIGKLPRISLILVCAFSVLILSAFLIFTVLSVFKTRDEISENAVLPISAIHEEIPENASVIRQEIPENAVSRFDCLIAVMQTAGHENSTKIACIYGGFVLRDMDHGEENFEYVYDAYYGGVTYGEFISSEEMENSPEQHQAKKKAAVAKVNRALLRSLTGINLDLDRMELTGAINEDGSFQFYLPDGRPIPDCLMPPVMTLRHSGDEMCFSPSRTASVNDCIAFMSRILRKEESPMSLENAWQYAREIGLVKPDDDFFDKPKNDLTADMLETLLSRFSEHDPVFVRKEYT